MSVGSAAGAAATQLVDGSAATVQEVDVAKVRAILVGLGQRVNGPPGHPPPPPPATPSPKYYNVSGAGDGRWDGQYTLSGYDTSGYPTYVSPSKACPNAAHCSLYAWEGEWRLALRGKELFYTAGSKRSALPPLSGWQPAVEGIPPAPTLKAGPPV